MRSWCAVSMRSFCCSQVLKQRVQADIYPNAVQGAAKLITTEGIGGFYKGARLD